MRSTARIPVLMYHQVGRVATGCERRYAIPAKRFTEHMRTLAKAGYQAVTLDNLLDWINGAMDLPEGAFVITFDDGYRGVYEHAQALLEQMQWPYTVFLVSDLIGKNDHWTQEDSPGCSCSPLLNIDEIQYMSRRGCSFQSHSRSHYRLPLLSDANLANEVSGSRYALAEILGAEVSYLAYPYGQFNDRVVVAAQVAGYRAACSTQSGFNQRGTDCYAIRRIDVYGTDTADMLLRKIRLGSNDGSLLSLMRYYLRRLLG